MTLQQLLEELGVQDFTGITDDELQYEVTAPPGRFRNPVPVRSVEWKHNEKSIVIDS